MTMQIIEIFAWLLPVAAIVTIVAMSIRVLLEYSTLR